MFYEGPTFDPGLKEPTQDATFGARGVRVIVMVRATRVSEGCELRNSVLVLFRLLSDGILPSLTH